MEILTSDKYFGSWNYSTYKDWADEAKQAGHKWWVDGIPVSANLYNFLFEIKAKRSQVRLRVDRRPTCHIDIDHDNSYRVFNDVGITFPDTPDRSVGFVSYSDGTYRVQHDSITNEKYASYSDGYNIRKSKDIKKMVKVAMQYLKPLGFDKIMEDNERSLEHALASVRDPARSKLRSKLSVNADDIATEIAHMIATGYVPTTPQFKEAIDVMASEGAELRRLRDYKPRTCFVWAKQNSLMYKYSDASEPAVEVTNMNDVPEHIRDKLALLNIAEERSAIADVGVRVSSSVFWIFV